MYIASKDHMKIFLENVVSSVGISVYIVFLRHFNLPILPVLSLKKYRHLYRLFPICRLFVDIENVYIEIISITYLIITHSNLFLTVITLKILSEIFDNTELAATLIRFPGTGVKHCHFVSRASTTCAPWHLFNMHG